MNRRLLCTAFFVLGGVFAAPVPAAFITNVVEMNGDNEATDTITAKWTGQTFTVSIANEPVPGAVVGNPYTVGTFGHQAPNFVDRNHRYSDHSVDPAAIPPTFAIPAYLVGGDYIMSGNDNRDNNPPYPNPGPAYQLDVTVNSPVTAYMIIDNRMSVETGAADEADPPRFDATHMQWILDQGWLPTANGLNRTANPLVPDEVPIDEGANNSIERWSSVYQKQFPAGTFSLFQPDNAGNNMYGVVVVPEPSGIALGCGAAGLVLLKRRRSPSR
jgi:hypothetical protein